jgi:hypothetical protein
MGMNCVLLAPTGMELEFLAPMGRDPDWHPPRQPQVPEREAAGLDAPPNGLHQPQAGTSTGSAERERVVVDASLEDRPDPACRAACGVGPSLEAALSEIQQHCIFRLRSLLKERAQFLVEREDICEFVVSIFPNVWIDVRVRKRSNVEP